ncbi:low molecular weight protein-tyrosine-phosphatase [Paraburkholderia sp. J67]|uniref:low molecular weight protein-tyrosine-phosphatase n=1 Tax=Paraburkholderia sp. J67 TaxID=2805435 RepID=UPI002ABD4496|nr:low molecular weight protein-tyrosine-phosphatase [Paraburkholderia sp. J67]
MIQSILTVCVGNICRSPMAEGLLRERLPNANVSSAGIGALAGRPADPLAVALLEEKGIDITAHRAQQISARACRQADLILVMDEDQKRAVARTFSGTVGKLFVLGHYGKFDVFDPYRQGRERFDACFELIFRGVEDWVARIKAIA